LEGERDTFPLLECDGSVAFEALDRLSAMLREVGSPRPSLPLPSEPDPNAPAGEWSEGVHLVHPRLVWALQRIVDAFPHRPVYVVSGYRRHSGTSNHARGRAADIQVVGVSAEVLLDVCRTLRDVGCGYYPNGRFIHVDVRPYGSGHPLWIDVAQPGQPSEYVDSWPGVVESGALVFAGEQ
jgi:hypothetical protein